MNDSIRQQLFELAEPDYQKFSSRLLPGVDNLLGVRIPTLRKLAKSIVKSDWRAYLDKATEDTFEEVMLQGMVIGYANADADERLKYIIEFIPKITNWSVCDSFCSGLKKFHARNPEHLWDFVVPYVTNQREYFVRFGVIMLRCYYLDDTHIDQVLQLLLSVNHDGYYAKMAVAWAFCDCYIKFPKKTLICLQSGQLDTFTYQKALQKLLESHCVDAKTKEKIRQLKKNPSAK